MSFLSVPISLFPTAARTIADIPLQVVINESTNDTLTITKQPVQQGASIADHAYKEPTTLSMTAYFNDNQTSQTLKEIYSDLIELQNSRDPLTIVTPKRIYQSMLIASIGMTTDKTTENCLALILTFQEVIIVSVTTTTVPRRKQKSAAVTGATENAGNKSALKILLGGG